jgi:hypothetical protein
MFIWMLFCAALVWFCPGLLIYGIVVPILGTGLGAFSWCTSNFINQEYFMHWRMLGFFIIGGNVVMAITAATTGCFGGQR